MLEAAFAHFRDHLWLYLSMPLTSGVIGYGTNILAIRMMFYPLEFRGKAPYLGWQGVIPRKAAKMAGIAVDTMTERLIRPRDLFERLDADRVAREIEEPLVRMIDQIAEDVMLEHQPTLWLSLPHRLREIILGRIRNDAPAIVKSIMNEVKTNLDRVFDLKDMVVTNLVKDKRLLNRIFYETGRPEFRFVGNSGFYFGFLFGLVQMVVWMFYKGDWQLPAFGLLVGYATNWIALWMIFNPKDEWRVGPVVVQGLFLKRKDEVARDYGALIAAEILTPANIVEAILKGPYSDRLFGMIARHVKRGMDEELTGALATPFIAFVIGTRKYLEMKEAAVRRIIEQLPFTLKHVEEYAEDAMDIRNTLVSRMQQLTPIEFEGMLRPAFQEDEWILIAVGAFLGFLVGLGQLAMFAAAGAL